MYHSGRTGARGASVALAQLQKARLRSGGRMHVTKPVAVKDLSLDLKNYRALPQKSEEGSLKAIIAIDPDYFWALLASLLDDGGYLPTENIIVLDKGGKHIVKEGNRRVGALKLALGLLDHSKIEQPAELSERIAALGSDWKKSNQSVPCAVYPQSEAKTVDRIVTLIHGKGQKAGRLNWNAVARARHNRDELAASEPALDLLEAYIRQGKNLTPAQKERWAGDYPITVLEEALKRIAPAVGAAAAKDVPKLYPAKFRDAFEAMLREIGMNELTFEKLRTRDFGTLYGFPAPSTTLTGKANKGGATGQGAQGPGSSTAAAAGGTTGQTAAKGANRGKVAVSTTNPRAIKRLLKDFRPQGKGRDKLVTLIEEARCLDIVKTPHAFCFVLRSMFELSAKAYCKDHSTKGGQSATKQNGEDRPLLSHA